MTNTEIFILINLILMIAFLVAYFPSKRVLPKEDEKDEKDQKKDSVCYRFLFEYGLDNFSKTYTTKVNKLTDTWTYSISPKEQLMKELKSGFITDPYDNSVFPVSKLLKVTQEKTEIEI